MMAVVGDSSIGLLSVSAGGREGDRVASPAHTVAQCRAAQKSPSAELPSESTLTSRAIQSNT